MARQVGRSGALTDLNEEMQKAAKKIQGRMTEDVMFRRSKSSPFISTGRMAASISRQPFRPFVPLWDVLASPYVVEKSNRSREKKESFWRRLWASLTDLNPWPYSAIEYYEVGVPAIIIDRPNYRIICHPSLEQEIKKAVNEGQI